MFLDCIAKVREAFWIIYAAEDRGPEFNKQNFERSGNDVDPRYAVANFISDHNASVKS